MCLTPLNSPAKAHSTPTFSTPAFSAPTSWHHVPCNAPCCNLQCCLVCDAVLLVTQLYRCWSATPSWSHVDRRLSAAGQYVDRSRSDGCDPTQRQQVPAGLVRARRQLRNVHRRIVSDTVAEQRRPPRKKVLEKTAPRPGFGLDTRPIWDQEILVLVLTLQLAPSSWFCTRSR